MDEFDRAWRTGLLVRLQHSGGAAVVDSRTKHSTAHDNGHAARLGPGSATGNLERGEARTFARPCAFLGHIHIIGDSGFRALPWLIDSVGAECMVPGLRALHPGVWKVASDVEHQGLGG